MKKNIIAWAWFFMFATAWWAYADLTSHVEATFDALLLALDSNANGQITDETWFSNFILQSEVDNTPVDAVTDEPISSNWAYDHVNDADQHSEYLQKADNLSDLNNVATARTNLELGTAAVGDIEDDVYGAGWNGDTTNAPSQNAVYDKIETIVDDQRLDEVGNPTANKTFDVGNYTIAFDLDTSGSFRIGDVGGGNYIECLNGKCRMVGTYYLEGSYSFADIDASGEYGGTVDTYTVDETTVFGDIVYMDTDGHLMLLDSSVAGDEKFFGVVIDAGSGAGKKIITSGKICDTNYSFTVGGNYIYNHATTNGEVTQTIPTADFGQKIGKATSSICFFIEPGLVAGGF